MIKLHLIALVRFSLICVLATSKVALALPVDDQVNDQSLHQEKRDLTEDQLDAQYSAANTPKENFDPQRANPAGKITCFGDRFDLALPLQGGWNPNDRSYQQICAKPQYGGGPEYQHVGGWCSNNVVAFDNSDEAKVSKRIMTPRVLLSCRYRCNCTSGIPDPTIQPKANEHMELLQVGQMDSPLTYQISLDINNDFTVPYDQHLGTSYDDVNAIRLAFVYQLHPRFDTSNYGGQYVSEDQGNKITCDGALPTFRLPPPYALSDFESNQQLCAIQLDGGLFGANAGAYCHRHDSGTRTIWFADDLTPRPEWTWGGPSFPAAASIRFHCMQHCKCIEDETDKTVTQNLWNFIDGHIISLRTPSGAFVLDPDTPNKANAQSKDVSFIGSGRGSTSDGPPPKRPKTKSLTLLPPQSGANSPSGTCGPSNSTFCPAAWPTDLLGPIPNAPPNSSLVVTPYVAKGSKKDMTVCGNKCEGPQDCRSPALNNTETDHACTCALPGEQDAHLLGLDPVAPVAVCLVLMRAVFWEGKMGKKVGELNGRGLEERSGEGGLGEEGLVSRWVDSRGAVAQCRCNATFVHEKCCGSGNGMVWLG